MFDEQEPLHKIESPSGNPAGRQSPDAFETEVAAQLAAFKPIGGEIEVTPSALKLGMCIFTIMFFTCLKYVILLIMSGFHKMTYPLSIFLEKSGLSLNYFYIALCSCGHSDKGMHLFGLVWFFLLE